MKTITREYLTRIRHDALLTGNLPEVARISKIAKFNGITF